MKLKALSIQVKFLLREIITLVDKINILNVH